jgi:outer membrane lipoprotein-sorting protein
MTTSMLRLTPKGSEQFTSIDVWVSQQSWIPVRLSVVERNSDVTVVTFKNPQLNANVPNDAFSVNLPGGTKIVK